MQDENILHDDNITVAIALGDGKEMGLNNKNELVIQGRSWGHGHVNLGPFTKKRARDLATYLQRLAIHVE